MKVVTVTLKNGKKIQTADNKLNTWVRDLKTGKLERTTVGLKK